MTSAVYGLMKIGRCVEEDYGHMGCHNEAVDVMDAECSVRRQCNVLVSIQNFRKDSPSSCLKVLAGYLQVEYYCQEG